MYDDYDDIEDDDDDDDASLGKPKTKCYFFLQFSPKMLPFLFIKKRVSPDDNEIYSCSREADS